MHKPDPQPALQDRFLDHRYILSGRLIDPLAGTVSWEGKTGHLRRKELEMLALLASTGGAVVPRQAFIAVVWDGNKMVGDHAITNTMSSLRQALHDADNAKPLIRTIPRRGYQLAGTLEHVPTPQRPAFSVGDTVVGSPGWRLLRRLGGSDASETWLAEPSVFNVESESGSRRVFRFCQSEAYLRQLQREITLSRLVSQRLAERTDMAFIRDWQLDEPPYFVALDYATQGSLDEWANAVGLPVAQSERLRLMATLIHAVAALHALGLAHRQLDSKSILVDAHNDAVQLKISAFGLGELADHSQLDALKITAAGLTLGGQSPTLTLSAAEDIAALGRLLLKLALSDLKAEASPESIGQISNESLRVLIARCLGASEDRPGASALALQFDALHAAPSAAIQAEALASNPTSDAPAEAAPAAIPATSAPGISAAPKMIGNYRLLDRLGEGGMGTVYLAEQREPVQRKVALKVIRSGLDGDQILTRFDAERQALALMSHPNVAAVLESGLADDGRPFFAMEYIAGSDINGYCDAHHLNVPARVRLFLQVCDGVLHAHQKGVLHRDLKPSNLMVSSTTEGTGLVKIIDFGLAKSIHGKLIAQTLHTSFGAFVGTPVYCSPEHITGSVSGVDTRSDIYSMGVVLYELLVGMTPIASASLEDLAPEKIRELICKSKLPSMREQLLSAPAEQRSAIASSRATAAEELPQTLQGDLSWVVGKCLERDPNDRYASVLELKKDLQRWLEFRPVEARPTSSWYRFRKLVRRNRKLSILVAASVAALLLTSSAAIVGYFRAERALESARVAAAESEAAADFQLKQLRSLRPGAMGESLRALLAKSLAQSQRSRGRDETEITAALTEFTRTTAPINFTDIALAQLDQEFFSPTLVTINKDYGDHPNLQARLWQSLAKTWSEMGRYEAALEPQNLALERFKAIYDERHPQYLAALAQRGSLYMSMRKFAEAETDLSKAIRQLRETLGNEDPRTLDALDRFALLKLNEGKLLEAKKVFRDVLAGRRRILGSTDPSTLTTMSRLGAAYSYSGNSSEAVKLLEAALPGLRQSLGATHGTTLGTFGPLAIAYADMNKPDLAETYFRKDVEGRRAFQGTQHVSTRSKIINLAYFLIDKGEFDEAESLLLEVKNIEANLPPEAIGTTVQHRLESLSQVYSSTGRLREASTLLEEATELAKPKLPAGSFTYARLGELRRVQGDFKESERLFRIILDAAASLGPESPYTLKYQDGLAYTLQLSGNLTEAQIIQEQSVAGKRKIAASEDDPDLLKAQQHLGELLMRQGRSEEAAAMLNETYNRWVRTKGPEHRDTLDCMLHLSQALEALGKHTEALELADKAATTARRILHPKDYRLGLYLTRQAEALMANGIIKEVPNLLEGAIHRFDGVETLNPAYAQKAIETLVQFYEGRERSDPGKGFTALAQKWQGRKAERVLY